MGARQDPGWDGHPDSLQWACLREEQRGPLGLSGKGPAIVNIMRMVCETSMKPAATESGLECACVSSDDFTVLVSGGGRGR